MTRPRAALFSLLLLSCASQAQLIVVIETNLDVPLEIDAVDLSIGGADGISTVFPQRLALPDSPSFPLTLGITPETDSLGPLTITAIGRRVGEEVVRQTATVTMTPGETRVVHLVLYRSCVGRACGAAETCDAAGCVGRARDDLPPWTGTPPTFDDSDPCLAMAWDADSDGEGSVECGGTDCDDAEPLTSPAATETCDGIDNDCDGMTDEDCDCAPLDATQTCTTSCGSTGDQTCTPDGWSACATREETCNGIDDDCDGLTDEGQIYRASTPTPITATEAASVEPDVIWTGERYAIVWRDTSDEPGIHFQALDEAGVVLSAPARISLEGSTPAIAWSGSTFGVSWWWREVVQNPPTCTAPCSLPFDRVNFSVLSAEGAPMGSVRRVAADASDEPRPSIVWDGGRYVLGYRDRDMMLEARGEDGVRVGAPYTIPADREDTFEVVWTGAQLALAFTHGSSVSFTQGTLGAFPPTEQLVTDFTRTEAASMVWTGDGFSIAVSSNVAFRGGGPLESLQLDASGALVGTPSTLALSQPRRRLGSVVPAGMAAAPGQVIVTWIDTRDGGRDVYFARLAPDGTILQPATRASGPGGTSLQTTVAWSGQSFGAVWSEEPAGRDAELVFSRIACPP